VDTPHASSVSVINSRFVTEFSFQTQLRMAESDLARLDYKVHVDYFGNIARFDWLGVGNPSTSIINDDNRLISGICPV